MKRMRRFWITAVLTLILALTISAGAEAAPGRQSDWFVPFGELGKKPPVTWGSYYGTGYGPGCAFNACIRAEFVRDVTIPDGSFISPGKAFTKTWRIRNAGSCTWTTDFALVYVSGTALGSVQAVRLPHAVAPGKYVDISVSMVAPMSAGAFKSNWMLRSANGQLFGVGCSGQVPVWASIVTATAYASCSACCNPTPVQPSCVPACQPVCSNNAAPSIYVQPPYGQTFNPGYPAPSQPAYSVSYAPGYGSGYALKQPYGPGLTVPQGNTRNPYCNNKIRSINDLTIPDGTKLAPNEKFRKTWSFKNGGTCIWDQGYTLIFTGGDAMGGERMIHLPRTVYPGERVEISIDLQAPSIPGRYRGYYMVQDSLGYTFGYGSYANTAFWVDIVVQGGTASKSDAEILIEDETGPLVASGPVPSALATAAGEAIEAPLLMEETDAKTAAVEVPEGNACGDQHSEINLTAPDVYEVNWYLTNTGTNAWDPETYAIVNLENSPNVEAINADIALQPTKPGEETRVSFAVKIKDPASPEPIWSKFRLENNGTPFCEVYFPLR